MKNNSIHWISWPPLFRALELIWFKLEDTNFLNVSTLEQAAAFKKLMDDEIASRLTTAGFGSELHKLSGVWGEQYLGEFLGLVQGLMNKLLGGVSGEVV